MQDAYVEAETEARGAADLVSHGMGLREVGGGFRVIIQGWHRAGRYLRLQVPLVADLARRWATRTRSSGAAQSFTAFWQKPWVSDACCTDVDNVTVGGYRRRDAKAGTTRLPRATLSLSGCWKSPVQRYAAHVAYSAGDMAWNATLPRQG